MSDVAATAALTSPSAPPAPSSEHLGRSMWAHGSFSFKDLLDIVNPLQHLPVIGSIYRYLTGDEPSVGTRVIGDALYGGPIGFGVSVVSNALLTNESGQDLGERVLADVFGPRDHDSPTLGTPQVATGQPTPLLASPAVAQQQVPEARSTTALSARGIASAAAPMSLGTPAAAARAISPQSLAPVPGQPVAMNQLFRSAPPAPATPEQAFASQALQFQRQFGQGRSSNRPVPLELSSNLLPVMPAGGHLALGSKAAAEAGKTNTPIGQAQVPTPGPAAPDQNAIAQKMIDALNKYEQLKRQEEQRDKPEKTDQPKLDLAL